MLVSGWSQEGIAFFIQQREMKMEDLIQAIAKSNSSFSFDGTSFALCVFDDEIKESFVMNILSETKQVFGVKEANLKQVGGQLVNVWKIKFRVDKNARVRDSLIDLCISKYELLVSER